MPAPFLHRLALVVSPPVFQGGFLCIESSKALIKRGEPANTRHEMLQFEKMTVKAQEALRQAQEVAARYENQQIEPVHLLEALVAQKDGVVPPLLARLGIHVEALNQEIAREITRLPKVSGL